MNLLFDSTPNRRGTASYKWDKTLEYFGKEDVIPLWVADMDFPCAKPIVDALVQRAQHPIYGYTVRTDTYTDAFTGWMHRRHQFLPEKKWLTFSPPGVIYAMEQLIKAATNPGDSIIVPTPDYTSFYDVVTGTGRTLIQSPMIWNDNNYALNLEHIEKHAAAGAKALIFSSPSNPTGRVWLREELLSLIRLCKQYDMLILCDEIYADFVFKGNTHLPILAIDPEAANRIVAFYSASKCFNMGGLQLSTVVIPDDALREKYDKAMYTSQTRLDNIFGAVALESAYLHGDEWLDQVIEYVAGNRALVERALAESVPGITACPGEGTFLMWLDCRGLGIDSSQLQDFFIGQSGVVPTFGDEFGPAGEGFVRMNIACSRHLLEKALSQMSRAKRQIG